MRSGALRSRPIGGGLGGHLDVGAGWALSDTLEQPGRVWSTNLESPQQVQGTDGNDAGGEPILERARARRDFPAGQVKR